MVEADGWYHVRTTGSHKHFRHTTKAGIVTIRVTWGKMFRQAHSAAFVDRQG